MVYNNNQLLYIIYIYIYIYRYVKVTYSPVDSAITGVTTNRSRQVSLPI